jgi:hypothetical protein
VKIFERFLRKLFIKSFLKEKKINKQKNNWTGRPE